MATLVIHAPRSKANQQDKKSFDTTFKSGIGEGYAIHNAAANQLHPGCKVVLLRKDEKRRAEGALTELVRSGMTNSGIPRYDVHISGLTIVKYKEETINRRGIAAI